MSRVRSRARAATLFAAGLVAAGAVALGGVGPAACTSTTAVNASLVSGIFIPSSLLLDNGNLGCSDTDPLDVYKYVAIVINDRGDIGGAGVFDCFSEIVFANLPGTDGGALDFAVWVYAYNPPDFAAANAGGKLTTAVIDLNAVNRPDGSVYPIPSASIPEAGAFDASFFTSALATICRTRATWVTACSATSQASVQSLANCHPLALENAVPKTCNLPVLLPDAGPDAFHD